MNKPKRPPGSHVGTVFTEEETATVGTKLWMVDPLGMVVFVGTLTEAMIKDMFNRIDEIDENQCMVKPDPRFITRKLK